MYLYTRWSTPRPVEGNFPKRRSRPGAWAVAMSQQDARRVIGCASSGT
jgi:hypothetical protein